MGGQKWGGREKKITGEKIFIFELEHQDTRKKLFFFPIQKDFFGPLSFLGGKKIFFDHTARKNNFFKFFFWKEVSIWMISYGPNI